jgi:hypothetical protein
MRHPINRSLERQDLNSQPPSPQAGPLAGPRYALNLDPDYSARYNVPQNAETLLPTGGLVVP